MQQSTTVTLASSQVLPPDVTRRFQEGKAIVEEKRQGRVAEVSEYDLLI